METAHSVKRKQEDLVNLPESVRKRYSMLEIPLLETEAGELWAYWSANLDKSTSPRFSWRLTFQKNKLWGKCD